MSSKPFGQLATGTLSVADAARVKLFTNWVSTRWRLHRPVWKISEFLHPFLLGGSDVVIAQVKNQELVEDVGPTGAELPRRQCFCRQLHPEAHCLSMPCFKDKRQIGFRELQEGGSFASRRLRIDVVSCDLAEPLAKLSRLPSPQARRNKNPRLTVGRPSIAANHKPVRVRFLVPADRRRTRLRTRRRTHRKHRKLICDRSEGQGRTIARREDHSPSLAPIR